MQTSRFSTFGEQAASLLRAGIQEGRWVETMPGRATLSAELGVSGKTMDAALRLLEKEGLLVGQGAGRRRKIAMGKGVGRPVLRVGILDYDPLAQTEGYMVELQHLLTNAGHTGFFARKSLTEMGMEVELVARLVKRTPADAWIVGSGSQEVLGWFVAEGIPAFALFGRMEGQPIAGAKPNKQPALVAATRHLIGLGHRRIVMVGRGERRLPEPGRAERAFLAELEAHDIPTGSYNLPDWAGSAAGLHTLLVGLFRATPPTALFLEEAPFLTAALQFCSQSGIRVPEDLSLISLDGDPHFSWCEPSIAHVAWDSRPVLRRIVRWADMVARGVDDRSQTLTNAEFFEGGTIGPAARA